MAGCCTELVVVQIHYIDCRSVFLTEDGQAVIEDLMPDGLHPNGPGVATAGVLALFSNTSKMLADGGSMYCLHQHSCCASLVTF